MFYGDVKTIDIAVGDDENEIAYRRRSFDEMEHGADVNPFAGKIEVLGYVSDYEEDTIITDSIPESDRDKIEDTIDQLTGNGWIGFE